MGLCANQHIDGGGNIETSGPSRLKVSWLGHLNVDKWPVSYRATFRISTPPQPLFEVSKLGACWNMVSPSLLLFIVSVCIQTVDQILDVLQSRGSNMS